MSGDWVSVDMGSFDPAVKGFREVQADIEALFRSIPDASWLQSATGSDQAGQEYFTNFTKSLTGVTEAGTNLGKGYGATGEAIDAWKKVYEATDDGNLVIAQGIDPGAAAPPPAAGPHPQGGPPSAPPSSPPPSGGPSPSPRPR